MFVESIEVLSCNAGWRNYHFLKLVTSDGVVGWAEFDEGFGSPGVSAAIDALAPSVIGGSVGEHERIHERLFAATRPASAGVIGQALGAIENALLDAKAKSLGVPCYELLGGRIRDRIPVYWSHCGTWRVVYHDHYGNQVTDLAGIRALGEEVRDRGFSALKTNTLIDDGGGLRGWIPGFGRPFRPDLNVDRAVLRDLRALLEAFRDGAGTDVDIMVDLNFNARTEGYASVVRELSDLDLSWIEIDSDSPEGLAHIRRQSANPISGGETLFGIRQFLPYFRSQALDVAIVDGVWNGMWQAMKMAAAAAAHEINVAPHNFHGHLCTMMNAHFSAAVPNLRIMETDIDRLPWDDDLVTERPVFEGGDLVLGDQPGWGTDPVEEAIRAHPPAGRGGLVGPTNRD
ncbi:MAG: mandelate racemase/muconate lactonizing enzyme family protein [Acidimicrobiia bacterium]|nr:mandelate racemase/muconate lactonizing enzyme family protein [Acidimicrobiia bacterium]